MQVTILRAAKYLGALVAVVVALFLFVVNFSAVESRFECKGILLTIPPERQLQTLYLKLAKYRWWVGLWSDSDAGLWIEVPGRRIDYYEHVKEVGDFLHIHMGEGEHKAVRGMFSTLSKTLSLGDADQPFYFEGACKKIDG